ncbi:MAG: hypothetical protein R3B70_16210 [Polyangiaceae bacterium]
MRRTSPLFLLALLPVLSLATPALADDAPPAPDTAKTDKSAAAEELFRQGIQLMKEGKFADACPKLEASNKVSWAPGTTINLADCYEQLGRLASAWAKYLEAEPHFRNRTPPDDRADIAKERAEALYPKLSRINITVPAEAKVAGLTVTRDGDPVDESQWGNGLPVDPGKHVVEVTAPGKKPWRWEAEVGAGGATVSVNVPVLEAQPNEDHDPVAPVDSSMPVQRKVAIGAGAAGVVGLAIGGIFGGLTLGKVGDANKTCTPNGGDSFICDEAGAKLRDEAKGLSTISTVGLIAGGILAAGGVVLWFTAPSGPAPSKEAASRRSLFVAPVVGQGTTGLTAGGKF